jgi:hypothetical protein
MRSGLSLPPGCEDAGSSLNSKQQNHRDALLVATDETKAAAIYKVNRA